MQVYRDRQEIEFLFTLVYVEELEDRKAALKREKQIKKL